VLEVNNTCSLAPASYFQISVEAVGSSKKEVIHDILLEAEHAADQMERLDVTAAMISMDESRSRRRVPTNMSEVSTTSVATEVAA
jgi:hypothetical protein